MNQRYRVVADLTEAEYNKQARMAETDPERHPPLLEMVCAHGSRHFTEDRIPLIVYDAIMALHGEINGTEDADPYDVKAHDVSGWEFHKKLRVMELASEGWDRRDPDQGEGSYWAREAAAETLLREFPDLVHMFEGEGEKN